MIDLFFPIIPRRLGFLIVQDETKEQRAERLEREGKRRWYFRHKAEINAKRHEPKEQQAVRSKRWLALNKEKHAAQQRAYRLRNAVKVAEYQRLYRLRKKNTGTEPRPSDAQISLEVCDVIDADYKDGGVW